jgi:hypothetical protein
VTLVLVEGFDHYNGTGANTGLAAKWTVTTSTGMVAGRFGGQAFAATNANNAGSASRTFTADDAPAIGLAYRATTMPTIAAGTVAPHFALQSAGTYMVGFRIGPNGEIIAYRLTAANAGTVLGTSANGVIAANTWHYIELELVVHDTTGAFKLYVDGVQVLNLTNVDTRNGAPTTVDTIQLGNCVGTTGVGVHNYDDLYIDDGGVKLGERRVETLYPTSDVAQGFARSAGAVNYSLVDEATANGDTDYVQGSVVGDVDTYGLGDLSSTPAAITAVQFNAYAMKTDAAARSIALQAKSGATTSDGANLALAGSYGLHQRLMLTDPNTAAAWAAAAVNALQGGPKVTV